MRNKLYAGALALALSVTTVFSGIAPVSAIAGQASVVQAAENTTDAYTYCYAGLTWNEYWASEGVYAAGSEESSETLDGKSEADLGAFDAVTRATTKHGLHRGSYQCTAEITGEKKTYKVSYWTDSSTAVLTDGSTITFSKGTITSGTETDTMKEYKVLGIKYVPVRVAKSDFDAFKDKYDVVENGGTLAGGYTETNLNAYSVTANVTASTNGLKTATKNADGSFSFSARATGTDSGIEGTAQKKVDADNIGAELKSGDAIGSFGEFIRLDFTGTAYGDLGANMQAVKWTYYGNDSTYTNAIATYGTKFAADNWMHKSMGIQLGLSDSLRCQFPENYNGTGYWTVTVYALGYEDFTYSFQVGEDNIASAKVGDIDTSKLEALVNDAQALNKEEYTEDSWSNLDTELQESVDMLAGNPKPTNQAMVNEQITHLTDAMNALVKASATTEKKDDTTTAKKDETTTAKKDETTTAKKNETTTGKKNETTTGKKNETKKTSNVKLKKPTLKVKKVTKKSAKLTWKKVKKATGYQIQYTKKSFSKKKSVKTITIKKGSTTSKQLKKLAKKTKYKVRIRAYYAKSGYKTVYSGWATKTVKTK